MVRYLGKADSSSDIAIAIVWGVMKRVGQQEGPIGMVGVWDKEVHGRGRNLSFISNRTWMYYAYFSRSFHVSLVASQDELVNSYCEDKCNIQTWGPPRKDRIGPNIVHTSSRATLVATTEKVPSEDGPTMQ